MKENNMHNKGLRNRNKKQKKIQRKNIKDYNMNMKSCKNKNKKFSYT